MDAFEEMRAMWHAWAIRHARDAWYIANRTEPPPVDRVVMNTMRGLFEVHYEGGVVVEVENGGLGRIQWIKPQPAGA